MHGTRIDEARGTARDLLRALEDDDASANQVLMKAQKLARLMRDEDAQEWLKFEMYGYPAKSDEVELGRCVEYAWRFNGADVAIRQSLPKLEAEFKAAEALLQKMQQWSAPNSPIENYLAAAATQKVLTSVAAANNAMRQGYVATADRYQRVRGSIHRYAVDALIAIELGDAVESTFEAARAEVDAFVAHCAPKAAGQLVAASERMRDGTNEGRSAALTACRRLLVSVADAVFPAQSVDHVDGRGRKRKIGPEEYKNRLLAYVESRLSSATTRSLVIAQLEHVAARLDALNENVCRGVHADVTEAEARLTLIDSYVFLAELARLRSGVEQPTAGAGSSDDASPTEAAEVGD
jgi:hypothetical protein